MTAANMNYYAIPLRHMCLITYVHYAHCTTPVLSDSVHTYSHDLVLQFNACTHETMPSSCCIGCCHCGQRRRLQVQTLHLLSRNMKWALRGVAHGSSKEWTPSTSWRRPALSLWHLHHYILQCTSLYSAHHVIILNSWDSFRLLHNNNHMPGR